MMASFQMMHAQPFGYVTNYGSDTVSIFDATALVTTGFVDNGGFDITNPVDVHMQHPGLAT